MKRIICTITDFGYQKYTQKLIDTIRKSGWREEIVVFNTDDKDLYFNCRMIKIKPNVTTRWFDDGRWIKMELPNHFELGDKICFLDSDMIAFPWVDWEDIFDGDLSYAELKPDDDMDNESGRIRNVYGDINLDSRYLASPAMMTVTEEMREFYSGVGRLASFASNEQVGGTLLALNLALNARPSIKKRARLLPRAKIVYTVDVRGNQKNYMPFEKPWFFHYGGSDGKKYWHQEHELALDLGYLKK